MADALRSVGAAATSAPIEQLETMLEMHARGAASSFGIIVFAPDSEDAPYLPVRLLQAVMKTKWWANPKLWLVTRGAQSPFLDRVHRVSIDQAALWGAARVVGEEHPELWGGLVDFDPISDVSLDADRFARRLAASDGEDQIAFRGSRRYVLRLMPASGEQKAETFAWRPDGAYLISGGLGDIGLRVAGELAAHGVRRLILVGRTPLPSREQWNETDPESKIGGVSPRSKLWKPRDYRYTSRRSMSATKSSFASFSIDTKQTRGRRSAGLFMLPELSMISLQVH